MGIEDCGWNAADVLNLVADAELVIMTNTPLSSMLTMRIRA
jgi:hypothetical protein